MVLVPVLAKVSKFSEYEPVKFVAIVLLKDKGCVESKNGRQKDGICDRPCDSKLTYLGT